MIERDFGPVAVDVCERCGGLWFDWAELRSVDEPGERVGAALEAALERRPHRRAGGVRCSRCRVPMREHRYGARSHVLVDHCYECRGSFLDPGELAAIRLEIEAARARDGRVERILEEDAVWQQHVADLEHERAITGSIREARDMLMQRVRLYLIAPFS